MGEGRVERKKQRRGRMGGKKEGENEVINERLDGVSQLKGIYREEMWLKERKKGNMKKEREEGDGDACGGAVRTEIGVYSHGQ